MFLYEFRDVQGGIIYWGTVTPYLTKIYWFYFCLIM